MFVAVAAHEISTVPAEVARTCNRGSWTTKELVVATSPCGVRIVIGPSVASGGTVAVMRRSKLLADAFVNTELAPLKSTTVAPVKSLPKRVTIVPGPPLVGEKPEVKTGAGVGYQLSVKLPTGG